jgi:glycosyltransferase involved in cell wall biosynthesis
MAARTFDQVVAGRVARSADRVLAVSGSVVEHLAELGVARGRIGLATNGVDGQRFCPGSGRPGGSSLHAVLIGRLIANKGTMDALEAVAQVRASGRDVRLTLVGDGPLESKARERAHAPDLSGAVTLTGRVDDVERWLQGADVSLRPSYTEGLPLAVLESLACGTPVICSNLAGNTEVIRHGHNGLVVEPGDVAALAAALGMLHDDRVRLGQLAAVALVSSADHSWERSVAAHLDAFESVASLAVPVG